jgi:flagellar basal-body rod modification protein FlgD
MSTSTSAVNSSSQIQMDYMKLLVTQLQNQNPLEPMNNDQMATQLTQISQLQQLESMSTSFADVLATTNRNYANSLLGKNITFFATNDTTGEVEQKVGSVDSVYTDPSTQTTSLGVTVGTGDTAAQYTVGLNAVVLVEN